LTTYPYLCYKFGTIPANEVNYETLQSLTSQEAPRPQASWNLQIIAVWNSAAQLHLNSHNPTWLQNIARDVSEADWHLDSITNDPTGPSRGWHTKHRVMYLTVTLGQRLVSRSLGSFRCDSNKIQTTKCPHRPAM